MSSAQRTGPAAVRGLLTDATAAYADHPQAVAVLKQHLDRVDEPLRVAIAGKMKAGKSTLLNALVGEEIAPTDAGECTKVVTWYEYAATPRVSMIVDGGRTRSLPVRRVDGKLAISLGRPVARRGGTAAGAVALPQPAGQHADRHPRDRLALDRGVGPHHHLPDAERRAVGGGRDRLPACGTCIPATCDSWSRSTTRRPVGRRW